MHTSFVHNCCVVDVFHMFTLFFLTLPLFFFSSPRSRVCLRTYVCGLHLFRSPSFFTQELAALLLVPRLWRVGLGRLAAGRQSLFSVWSLLWKRLHIKLFSMCMFNYILHQPSFLSCLKVTVSAALIELQVFFFFSVIIERCGCVVRSVVVICLCPPFPLVWRVVPLFVKLTYINIYI